MNILIQEPVMMMNRADLIVGDYKKFEREVLALLDALKPMNLPRKSAIEDITKELDYLKENIYKIYFDCIPPAGDSGPVNPGVPRPTLPHKIPANK